MLIKNKNKNKKIIFLITILILPILITIYNTNYSNFKKNIIQSLMSYDIGFSDRKNLVDEGLIDSLDILTITSEIEKKTNKKIDISKPKNFNKFNKYKDLINI